MMMLDSQEVRLRVRRLAQHDAVDERSIQVQDERDSRSALCVTREQCEQKGEHPILM